MGADDGAELLELARMVDIEVPSGPGRPGGDIGHHALHAALPGDVLEIGHAQVHRGGSLRAVAVHPDERRHPAVVEQQ